MNGKQRKLRFKNTTWMRLRGLISDCGEQTTFCCPFEVIFTRYRSHFPSLFDLGHWTCSEVLTALAVFHELLIWGRSRRAPTVLFHQLKPEQRCNVHTDELNNLTLNVKLIRLPISSSDFMALSPFTVPPNVTWLGLASLWRTSRSVGWREYSSLLSGVKHGNYGTSSEIPQMLFCKPL